ncbi:sugar-binding protein, partial [Bacteroidota bacterium]
MRYTVFVLMILCLNIKFYSQEDTNFCDKPEVTFYYTNLPITIDGDDEDGMWQAITEETTFLGWNVWAVEGVDESDISFEFKGAWDETGIYLLVEVTDDILVRHLQEENQSTERWQTDRIEYFFNPDGKRSIEGQEANFVHASQICINTGDEALDTPFVDGRFMGFTSPQQDPDGSIFQYGIDYPSGGYITESWFSWDAILPENIYGVEVEGLPKRWGFTINVADSDDPEVERDAIALWAGSGLSDEQWRDVNYFGVLHLSDIKVLPDADLNEIYFYMQEEFQYMGSDKTIDFGRIDVNNDSTITIIIYNNGYVNFISSMEINGDGFELINEGSSLNIEPGSSEQISIKFTPEETDQFAAEFILYNIIVTV